MWSLRDHLLAQKSEAVVALIVKSAAGDIAVLVWGLKAGAESDENWDWVSGEWERPRKCPNYVLVF